MLDRPKQLKLTEEDIKAYIAGEPITYTPRMPLERPRKVRGEFPEGGSQGGTGEGVKRMDELLIENKRQLTENELDSLEWAKEFMKRYEKSRNTIF